MAHWRRGSSSDSIRLSGSRGQASVASQANRTGPLGITRDAGWRWCSRRVTIQSPAMVELRPHSHGRSSGDVMLIRSGYHPFVRRTDITPLGRRPHDGIDGGERLIPAQGPTRVSGTLMRMRRRINVTIRSACDRRAWPRCWCALPPPMRRSIARRSPASSAIRRTRCCRRPRSRVTSLATGASSTAVTTTNEGMYLVVNLAPGEYLVQAEATGFQRFEQTVQPRARRALAPRHVAGRSDRSARP